MVLVHERRLSTIPLRRSGTRVRVITAVVVFAAVAAAFWLFWPVGVLAGLVVGCAAVLSVGRRMQAAEAAQPSAGFAALTGEDDLTDDLRELRERIGEDWAEFRRAVLLVTRAQWASVAALQRELRITTAFAQHLMGQLEREGFVGAPRGTRPRVVRVPRDQAEHLERVLG